eukprot:2684630-Amphidinium_carterae.1
MWAEVKARINRVDAVATKKFIQDGKLAPVPNTDNAKFQPINRIHGVKDDEDFGNIFESAGTVSILRRDLRAIRRIFVALIGKLSEPDAEKFWKWEAGFGYQSDGSLPKDHRSAADCHLQSHHCIITYGDERA